MFRETTGAVWRNVRPVSIPVFGLAEHQRHGCSSGVARTVRVRQSLAHAQATARRLPGLAVAPGTPDVSSLQRLRWSQPAHLGIRQKAKGHTGLSEATEDERTFSRTSVGAPPYAPCMSLPSAYLTSFKNTEAILQAIQAAQAPSRFTQRFLEGLGFANTNDRAIINVLKALGFLDDAGVPQARYHRYLDQTQSALVLAEGIREAYEDLFRVNRNAHTMNATEVKNKMKTLSEGAFTDRVLTQMAGTFTTLVKAADFKSPPATTPAADSGSEPPTPEEGNGGSDVLPPGPPPSNGASPFGSLAYNINIQLPESRDPAVYNAIFKALREHLR
jgi:hypothetical protein